MRQRFLAMISFGAFAFAFSTTAQAVPLIGGQLPAAKSIAEKMWWKRICDEDGERCRRIWIDDDRDEDYDRRVDAWRFFQGDEDHREHEEHEEHEEHHNEHNDED